MKRVFYFTVALIILCGGLGFSYNTPQTGQAQQQQTIYASSLATTEYSPISETNIGITPLGGTPLYYETQTINYAYKVVEQYINPYALPAYISNYSCGITAAGAAIGYYDRIFDELIPNHTGKIFLGKYLYATQGSAYNSMTDSLYSLMGATPQGVTLNGYINGFKSYVSSRGRTASFSGVMSGAGQMNSVQYKSALQSEKLLSVFMNGFTIIDLKDFKTYTNYDSITVYVNSGAHIMAVYGYLDVSYYNEANQCFRKDSYLYANTGYSTAALALVKLNQYCVIDDCYITEIN